MLPDAEDSTCSLAPVAVLTGCMDFQNIVNVCRKHYLYSALFYVYNKGTRG